MDNSEKYMYTENIVKTELNKDKMLERGNLTANGYTFVVTPICLGEEDSYFGDMPFSPVPLFNDKKSDKPLSNNEVNKIIRSHIITLFSPKYLQVLKTIEREKLTLAQKKAVDFKQLTFFQRFLKRYVKSFYYLDSVAYPLTKWLQKKVYYNNKKVTFYDLERKYNLSKEEIGKMVIYMHDLSDF